MKLGILVNTDRHLAHVIGLTTAALAKEQEVEIFTMDGGTRLLGNSSFTELSGLEGVSMSLCEHSAKTYGVKTDALGENITCGGQLYNSMMNNRCDRVVVL